MSTIDTPEPLDREMLSRANINPETGLATDYLNHLNEIVMLLEMVPTMPECIDDIMVWAPKSYVEHFRQSGFAQKELAIRAYDSAAPDVRGELDDAIAVFDGHIRAVKDELAAAPGDMVRLEQIEVLVFTELRPLIDRMSGIIHGAEGTDHSADFVPAPSAQDAVDELFP